MEANYGGIYCRQNGVYRIWLVQRCIYIMAIDDSSFAVTNLYKYKKSIFVHQIFLKLF